MGQLYRNEKGRIIRTAEDVMFFLVYLGDDFDVSDLPKKDPGDDCPRTAEAQAIIDHVHSGDYKKGDALYDEVVEVHNCIANVHRRLSAGIVYEHYNEPNEGGVDEKQSS